MSGNCDRIPVLDKFTTAIAKIVLAAGKSIAIKSRKIGATSARF